MGAERAIHAAGRVLLSAVAVALASAAAGCGSGSSSAANTVTNGVTPPAHGLATADSGSTVHVIMKSLDFNPVAVDARVGQRVTWTNKDSSPHNVTYVSGPAFTSSRPVLRPGAKFSIRVKTPGTIHYYCTIHPWMQATIVVSP